MKRRLLTINAVVLALIAILSMFKWFEVIATNDSGPLLTRAYTGFAAFPALGPSLITGLAAILMISVSKGALRRVVVVLATFVALQTLNMLFGSFGQPSSQISTDFANAISDVFTMSGKPDKTIYLPTLFLTGVWALISASLLFVKDSTEATKSYSRGKPDPAVGAWAAISAGFDPTEDSANDSAGGIDGGFDGGFDGGLGGGFDGGAGVST